MDALKAQGLAAMRRQFRETPTLEKVAGMLALPRDPFRGGRSSAPAPHWASHAPPSPEAASGRRRPGLDTLAWGRREAKTFLEVGVCLAAGPALMAAGLVQTIRSKIT